MLKKMKIAVLAFGVLLMSAGGAYADYDGIFDRGEADTPIGVLFYVLGDIVSLPFDLLGSLF